MALERVKARVKLTREYLYHNPADTVLDGGRKVKTGTAGNDPEEWKGTYCATKEGFLYIKPEQLFGCMREAGKFTKKGRATVKNDIAATLQIEEPRVLINKKIGTDPIPVNDPDAPLYVDKRPVKNPATKGLNMRYRLAVPPGTEFVFHMTYDNTILNANIVSSVLHDAGTLVGIGDGRSIGKGRFEVVSCDLV
jgi:hypothetical protein